MYAYGPDTDRCDCSCIHEDVVNTVRRTMPNDDLLFDLADTFQLFSDSTRVRILCALMRAEMCVCDISVLLGMTKSSVSHQLRILKHAGLVKYRRAGRVVYYSLTDQHVKAIFDEGMIHVIDRMGIKQTDSMKKELKYGEKSGL